MKAYYRYSEPFGDILATVTGKSAARGRDSVHNLRWERTRYIDRIDELNRNVKNLRKANAVMRNHARKEGERMLADIFRLHNEAVEARRDYDNALRIADKDKQALMDKVERLNEENANLCAEIARLQAELADEQTFALHGWELARKNATLCAKASDRLHACRIDRRKWRDFANRCFMASLKNAVALADERKRGV